MSLKWNQIQSWQVVHQPLIGFLWIHCLCRQWWYVLLRIKIKHYRSLQRKIHKITPLLPSKLMHPCWKFNLYAMKWTILHECFYFWYFKCFRTLLLLNKSLHMSQQSLIMLKMFYFSVIADTSTWSWSWAFRWRAGWMWSGPELLRSSPDWTRSSDEGMEVREVSLDSKIERLLV